MRYLAKREDFLRQAKKTEQNSDFIRESKRGWRLITEEAPFENDIPWADSLAGRLFYHQIIQRIEDGSRLMRMPGVIRRLKSEFDRIVSEGYLMNLDEEMKKEMSRMSLHALFEALTIHVEKGAKVEVLKRLTVGSQEVVNKMDDKEKDKATLKKELDDFLKFLEQFKDDEGDGMDEDKEEDDDDDEESSDGLNTDRRSNLMALRGILEGFPSFKAEVGRLAKQSKSHQIVPGDTIQKLSNEYGVLPGDLIAMNSWMSGKKATDALPTKDAKGKPVSVVLERMISENAVSAFATKVANKIANIFKSKGGDKNAIQIKVHDSLKSLVKQIDELQNPKVKGVAVNLELVNRLLKKEEVKRTNVLYDEMKEFLSGKKKGEITLTGNELIKEELEKFGVDKDGNEMKPQNLDKNQGSTLGKDSPQIIDIDGQKVYVSNIAFKVARFWKFVEQFEKRELIDVLDVLQSNTDTFIKTGRKIAGATNESRLFNYEKFMSILEAEGDAAEAGAPEVPSATSTGAQDVPSEDAAAPKEIEGSVSEKIRDFYLKNCKTVKAYVMEKAEVDKIIANLEGMKKESGGLVINGIDPVIQICRLFNRAYKLYMRNAISQRQGGEIGATIAGRYTSFGSDKSGPFRINKVFNKWEDAVLKIMGDRKYEYIFSKDTKMRFPLKPDPKEPEDWEIRKGAGLALNAFMRELLDGDNLYKSGSYKDDRGAQAKFLEKYFGKLPESESEKAGSLSFGDDGKSNQEIAAAVDSNAIKLTFKKADKKVEMKPGMFFAIKYKDVKEGRPEGVSKTYYFWVLPDGKSVAFSGTFLYLDQLIKKCPDGDTSAEIVDGRKKTVDKGNTFITKIEISPTYRDAEGNTPHWQTNYANSRVELGSLFKIGNSLEFKYINGKDKRDVKTKTIKVEDIAWLSTPKEQQECYVANIKGDWLATQRISTTSDKSPFSVKPLEWLNERNTSITLK